MMRLFQETPKLQAFRSASELHPLGYIAQQLARLLRLYFVVPPDQYPKFKPKSIGQGTKVAKLREIEQWVLKMPY